MKISIKILSLFLAASLLLLLSCFAITGYMQQNYNTELMARQYDQAQLVFSSLERQLSSLHEQLQTISVSGDVNLLSFYQMPDEWYKIYEKTKTLHEKLYTLRGSYPYVQQAFLILPTLKRQITDEKWYEKMEEEQYAALLSQPEGICFLESDLYVYYELVSNHVRRGRGLVGVKISTDALLEHCMAKALPLLEVTMLKDDGEDSTAVLQESNTVQQEGEAVLQESESLQQESVTVPQGSEGWQRGEGGWYLLSSVWNRENQTKLWVRIFLSDENLQRQNGFYVVLYVALVLLFMMELLLFARILRRLVTEPLQKLSLSFDQIANGDTSIQIFHKSKDEFTEIYNHFNQNVNKLDELISEEYRARIEAQQAEIKYLQSQIQPHFLYNAFYQLYRICRMEDCETGAELALQLSGYYEYVTHGSEDGKATLAEEIEHTRKYILIQQQRYGDRLQVQYENAEADLEMRIPRLLLQPLVENSVKYCLETTPCERLLVVIRVAMQGNQTCIIVEDNGDTMTDEAIACQQGRLGQMQDPGQNSGILNVHRRLLLSGNEGLKLSRSALGGLKIEMLLLSAEAKTAES